MVDRRTDEGLRRLASARQKATSGRFALSARDPAAEALLRSSLPDYWSAMNWLEDTDSFGVAHDEIHAVGRLLRRDFERGCSLGPRDDGTFAHTCPVYLCHKRFGLSPGFTGDSTCSICFTDASACTHTPGVTYEVAAQLEPWCNICGDQGCRIHEVGMRYETEAGIVVTAAVLHEVSFVSQPAQPDSRVMEIPIDAQEIRATYGPLPTGAYLKCDKCLSDCDGFDEFQTANAGIDVRGTL